MASRRNAPVRFERWKAPLRVALSYCVFSLLWIFYSDRIVEELFPDRISEIQTYKGWIFVVITTLLIFVLLWRETASRLKIEDRLRQRQEVLEHHLDNTPLAAITWDHNMICTQWNRAASDMFGYTPEQAIGKSAKELIIPPEMDVELSSLFQMILSGKGGRQSINENVTQNGERITCAWYNTPIEEENGAANHIVSLALDITEQIRARKEIKTLNAELEQRVEERTRELSLKNHELESFSYSVSHDLRAPLRAIDGFSRLIAEEFADTLNDEGKRYFSRIQAAANHMAGLIDDLLELSRVSSHKLQYRQVNFSALCQDIVTQLQEGEPERQLTISIIPDIILWCDETALRGIMENLIGNAWKYTSKTPNAEISIDQIPSEKDDDIVLAVKDNGVGFDPAYSDKLFKPFERLHDPKEFEGSGIGLATVSRMIARLGGEVWGESTPGNGATFFIRLPALSKNKAEGQLG